MDYEYYPEWDREMQPSVIGVPIGCQPQPDGNVVQTPEKRGHRLYGVLEGFSLQVYYLVGLCG